MIKFRRITQIDARYNAKSSRYYAKHSRYNAKYSRYYAKHSRYNAKYSRYYAKHSRYNAKYSRYNAKKYFFHELNRLSYIHLAYTLY